MSKDRCFVLLFGGVVLKISLKPAAGIKTRTEKQVRIVD